MATNNQRSIEIVKQAVEALISANVSAHLDLLSDDVALSNVVQATGIPAVIRGKAEYAKYLALFSLNGDDVQFESFLVDAFDHGPHGSVLIQGKLSVRVETQPDGVQAQAGFISGVITAVVKDGKIVSLSGSPLSKQWVSPR